MLSKDKKAIVGVEAKDYFTELDRRDQQQIVMHVLGEVVDELFYEVHGKKALSWEGINTVAYFMGDIEIDPWVEWEPVEMFGDRIYWSATVRARNTKYNLASLGTAEAPELMEVYDRDERNQKIPIPGKKGEFKVHLEPDDKCRRKALGKAQRNAKRAVMPTAVLNKWLQYFIGMKLFKKGTRREKPEMPFKPKTVDAEYQVLNVDETQEPPQEEPHVEEPTEPEVEEKPRAKVGSPPRREKPKPVAEKPEEEPRGPPKSVEDVTERIASKLAGYDELVKITEYEDYYRIGRRKTLDKEIEDHLDFLVSEMGGEFDNENNEWRIPKT